MKAPSEHDIYFIIEDKDEKEPELVEDDWVKQWYINEN